MEFLTYCLVGAIATWLLTWSMIATNNEGPFYIYDWIRWVLSRPFMPVLVRDNMLCPVCVSWWAAALVGLLLPVYDSLTWAQSIGLYFVLVYALSGATVFWYRYIAMVYSVNSGDF